MLGSLHPRVIQHAGFGEWGVMVSWRGCVEDRGNLWIINMLDWLSFDPMVVVWPAGLLFGCWVVVWPVSGGSHCSVAILIVVWGIVVGVGLRGGH